MHECYLQEASSLMQKIKETVAVLRLMASPQVIAEIESYLGHADRQMDQIRRRVIFGEVIPHGEKVFSVFEPHTEWISKGKAGVPVELGLRVCLLEDQYGFILYHHVMENQTDDQVTVFMVEESQRRFPTLNQCSFDQGFHSPDNQVKLKRLLDHVILPKKGRLSKEQALHEHSAEFRQARRQHAAVESAINALEVHGLDGCPDHGLEAYKRYVASAIVSRISKNWARSFEIDTVSVGGKPAPKPLNGGLTAVGRPLDPFDGGPVCVWRLQTNPHERLKLGKCQSRIDGLGGSHRVSTSHASCWTLKSVEIMNFRSGTI